MRQKLTLNNTLMTWFWQNVFPSFLLCNTNFSFYIRFFSVRHSESDIHLKNWMKLSVWVFHGRRTKFWRKCVISAGSSIPIALCIWSMQIFLTHRNENHSFYTTKLLIFIQRKKNHRKINLYFILCLLHMHTLVVWIQTFWWKIENWVCSFIWIHCKAIKSCHWRELQYAWSWMEPIRFYLLGWQMWLGWHLIEL